MSWPLKETETSLCHGSLFLGLLETYLGWWMPRAKEHCPAQLETGRWRGSGGSLLLLLPPAHGDVTVLAKVQPSRPRPWGPRRPLWPGGLSHPESFGKRPQEEGPFVTHTPIELGEEHAAFSSLGSPLYEVLGRRGEEENTLFLASLLRPRTQPRAQPSTPFPTRGACAAEPPWSGHLRTSPLLPLSVGHLWGNFL